MEQHELILIGGGSGEPQYLLPAAKEALESADFVFSSKRFFALVPAEKLVEADRISQWLEQIPVLLQRGTVAVLLSGDPLLYSFCRTVITKHPEWRPRIIPGISSLQMLGCAFGLTMEEAAICSLHGRTCTAGHIAYTVAQHPVTFFLCAPDSGPREIAAVLLQYQLGQTMLFVGANLGSNAQQLWQGSPSEFLAQENPALCVAAVRNPSAHAIVTPALLPDRAFFRNESPMTKGEIRAIVLQKLQLFPDAVVWDIGAGTGSISVECARMCPFGTVFAVEYQEKALQILAQNKAYFQADAMKIIAGKAEAQLEQLPVPDCIFIGGSKGELPQLLQKIRELPKKIRLVMTAVTLETQAQAYALLQSFPHLEMLQITVQHPKAVGEYHVLQSNYPVTIFSCDTKED